VIYLFNKIIKICEIKYGKKVHMDALKEYGVVDGHRRSFKPCD